jgi:uncharacterized protein YjbJ (UPF0337 family)
VAKSMGMADRAKGWLKEKTGAATGNASLQRKGRDQQATGNFKASAKKVKDAFKKTV